MAAINREIGHSNPSVAPWSSFLDLSEEVPELQWPHNLRVYERMRSGDIQVAAMLLAGTLPIRRYKWFIVQEGASDEVTKFVAENLGLQVQGKDPEPLPRRADRFSHDFHLRHALLGLVFGHMFFEQVYRIDPDAKKAHLRKLAPRMPRTLSEIQVAPDGGLDWIRQHPSGAQNSQGRGLILPSAFESPKIPVDRLVAYVNDREGGHWYGRSILRPIFANWTIKDRLLRVDALKHERNGLGVPTIEAPEGATQKMLAELAQLAMAYKAGDKAGGALPYGAKLRLVGTEGTLPDTLGSIRYHDQQIARAMLEMFMELGTTETGSRALGGELIDFFQLGQQAIATWYADVTTEHVIEDLVDLNWGGDEPAPRLGFEPESDEQLAISDLGVMVDKGLVVVEEELQEHLRERFELPKPKGTPLAPPTTSQPDPAEEVEEAEPDKDAQLKVAARAGMKEAIRNAVGEPRPTAAGRELWRPFKDFEIKAQVDVDALEQTYETTVAVLVAEWSQVRDAQLNELAEQITEADGDLSKLMAISATPLGEELLRPRLQEAADAAADGAANEAQAQGLAVGTPQPDGEVLDARAAAIVAVMALSIREVAARKAVEFTGPSSTPAQVADKVKAHIAGLSSAFVEEQMGGGVSAAQNEGRFAVFKANENEIKSLYASEILDSKTCTSKGKGAPGCKEIDGNEYLSVAAAREDYAVSGYRNCRGGSKCRGTSIAIYRSEVPATVPVI